MKPKNLKSLVEKLTDEGIDEYDFARQVAKTTLRYCVPSKLIQDKKSIKLCKKIFKDESREMMEYTEARFAGWNSCRKATKDNIKLWLKK